jgi:hypothetical protein
MLHCVALVRTEVSEELSASFIRVTRIDELGTTLAVTNNQHTLCEEISRGVTSQKTPLKKKREYNSNVKCLLDKNLLKVEAGLNIPLYRFCYILRQVLPPILGLPSYWNCQRI